MAGFISKIVAVLLIVLALGVTPLTYNALNSDSRAQRIELNTLQNYIDIVADKGVVTEQDYTNFVKSVTATGYTYDVDVEAEFRRVYMPTTGSNETMTVYYIAGFVTGSDVGGVKGTTILHKGDIFTVTIRRNEASRTGRFFNVLGLVISPKEAKLTKMVRNNG